MTNIHLFNIYLDIRSPYNASFTIKNDLPTDIDVGAQKTKIAESLESISGIEEDDRFEVTYLDITTGRNA